MNITQMAFEFIAKNPDQKMRDIIAAFPDCKPVSVKSAVYRLYTEGRLETKATSCGFIYRVINDASCCDDLQDDFKSRGNLEQEKAAKKLEERSCIAGPLLYGTSSVPQAAARKLLSITFVRKMPASGKHAWGNHTLSVS
ncbi:TPA: hypothetical protein ACK1R2_004318 [Klebsiella pneumoniae]